MEATVQGFRVRVRASQNYGVRFGVAMLRIIVFSGLYFGVSLFGETTISWCAIGIIS